MLPRSLRVAGGRVYHNSRRHISPSKCLYSTRASKPLRILFCGSDHFSCASLRAVHQEQARDPELIESVDVLLRPGKLSGRGLKSIREGNHQFMIRLPRIGADRFHSPNQECCSRTGSRCTRTRYLYRLDGDITMMNNLLSYL
jgi:hypothetical protein